MSIDLKRIWLVIALFILTTAVGCEGDEGLIKSDDDDSSDDDDDNNNDDDDNNNNNDNDTTDTGDDDDDDTDRGDECPENKKKIYVLTMNKALYQFDPKAKTFTSVGNIQCNTGNSSDLAFSMSVSRELVTGDPDEGFAYILFVDKDVTTCRGIYKVSIKDARCIEKTKFNCGSGGFDFFGMAYSTDSADTVEETLFLAAGSPRGTGTAKLGTLDLETGSVASIGSMDLSIPEMTGNALGELWGLFPLADPPVISQLNKSTGKRGTSYNVTNIPSDPLRAFAGAFWGGDFYLFHMTTSDSTSKVYKVYGPTSDNPGKVELYMSSTSVAVSGAGVSTCAPFIPVV